MANTRTTSVSPDARIAGVVSPYAWDEALIEYAFPTLRSHYGPGYYDGTALSTFSPMDQAQKAAVRGILDADPAGVGAGFTVEGFTNLALREGTMASAELMFGIRPSQSGRAS